MNQKVSVILTTYNRPELLSKAIASVLFQTYTNFELIIIDDCSDKSTEKVINSFQNNKIIYIRNKNNIHLSSSRNIGIDKSSGEYICFLDDDDTWHKDKLKLQIDKFKTLDNNYGLVYSWMNIVSNKIELDKLTPIVNNDIFLESLHGQPIAAASSWMIRRSVIEKNIKFDSRIRRGIDGDFLRQLTKYFYVDFIPVCLVNYQVQHGKNRISSSSISNFKKSIKGNLITERKFATDFKKNPKIYSLFFQRILFEYMFVGSYLSAFSVFFKSLYYNFFSLRNFKVLIKIILFPIYIRTKGLNE